MPFALENQEGNGFATWNSNGTTFPSSTIVLWKNKQKLMTYYKNYWSFQDFYFHDVLEQLKTNFHTNSKGFLVLKLSMLEFLSFCVTWHLHDGRERLKKFKKLIYFREFCCLNSLCISITLIFLSSLRNKFMLLLQNSVTDVSVGFHPPCWCPPGWAPAWRLHTNLYKYG